jgi:transposase
LAGAGFAEAVVADAPGRQAPAPGAVIMIELSGGSRVSIAASTLPAAALKALR